MRGWPRAMPVACVSVNVGLSARGRLGRHRPHLHRQAPGGRSGAGAPAGAGRRPGLRHPHHGGPTRRSTRSRARTSTGGRASWARDPRRPVRREPHHARASTSTRPRSASGGGSAPRSSRSPSVRIPCNDFKNWMGRSGYDDAGLGQAVHRARAARCLPPRAAARASCRRATSSPSCTGPATASRVSTMFRALDHERSLLPRAARGRRPGREARREGRGVRRDVRDRWPASRAPHADGYRSVTFVF